MPRSVRYLCLAVLLTLPQSCAWWLFSGRPTVDRSRPVALVETTGGVELGATTEYGVLTLGRSAEQGPCRVRYFLGPTPMVEDGTLAATGSVFTRAEMDLRTQHIRVFDRPLAEDDALLAMWTTDGVEVESVAVELAAAEGISGDVLVNPGTDLPPGATVLADTSRGLQFVGLVSGRARLDGPGGSRTYYTFCGVDRVREMLAVPEVYPKDYRTEFRPDGISVRKPIR